MTTETVFIGDLEIVCEVAKSNQGALFKDIVSARVDGAGEVDPQWLERFIWAEAASKVNTGVYA